MKIVVCLKQVPDTTEIKIDPVKGTLIREGVPSIINPDDKAGLEAALTMKDKHGAEVIVLSMGPMQAEEALREALAMGADRAILLSDFKFAGADTLATSTALSYALKQLDYDFVITGRQAIDGDTAQVGPELAEFLDLPQITYAAGIDYKGDGVFHVTRKVEDRSYVLKVKAPFVMTVLSDMNKPRYMSVPGIIEAYREKKIDLWTADTIKADPARLGLKGSPTKVKESFAKALKQPGQLYEVDPQEATKIILDKLLDKFVL